MGFGPSAHDPQEGAKAIVDLVELLYPERSTPNLKKWLGSISQAILAAHAPLAFTTIARFLSDESFRRFILERASGTAGGTDIWDAYTGAIDPCSLDDNLAWLITDRLEALNEDSP